MHVQTPAAISVAFIGPSVASLSVCVSVCTGQTGLVSLGRQPV